MTVFELETRYLDTYEACKGETGDDRELFINMFNTLRDAIKEYEQANIENVYLRKAFTDMYLKETKILDAIEKSLQARNMI